MVEALRSFLGGATPFSSAASSSIRLSSSAIACSENPFCHMVEIVYLYDEVNCLYMSNDEKIDLS